MQVSGLGSAFSYTCTTGQTYRTIQNFGGIKLWRISSRQALADNILANAQTELQIAIPVGTLYYLSPDDR